MQSCRISCNLVYGLGKNYYRPEDWVLCVASECYINFVCLQPFSRVSWEKNPLREIIVEHSERPNYFTMIWLIQDLVLRVLNQNKHRAKPLHIEL